MARKHKNIRIVNPLPGERRYTCRRTARALIARGRAAWDGDNHGAIFLLPHALIERLSRESREQWEEEQVNRGIQIHHRGGIVWWNGKDRDPLATHRPGEVVS